MDTKSLNEMVENFFQVKFVTTYIKDEVLYTDVPECQLGTPSRIFSDENAHNMMKPISPQELNATIKMLGSDKAEGLDGITNDMIKNTGLEARRMILEFHQEFHSNWRSISIITDKLYFQ